MFSNTCNFKPFILIKAANLITKLEDLGELKSLLALHIRDNKLEHLDGFDERMISLQYLNLRFDKYRNLKSNNMF
jgi:hypothetical protein